MKTKETDYSEKMAARLYLRTPSAVSLIDGSISQAVATGGGKMKSAQ